MAEAAVFFTLTPREILLRLNAFRRARLRRQEELMLLLPLGADIAWQDGIYLSPDAARPDYRVAALERYPLHLRARLEKEAAHGA